MFLGGINFKQFLSEHTEWHALVEGLSDGFCVRESRHKLSDERKAELEGEHHYYNPARAVGFAALLVVGAALTRWVIGA